MCTVLSVMDHINGFTVFNYQASVLCYRVDELVGYDQVLVCYQYPKM